MNTETITLILKQIDFRTNISEPLTVRLSGSNIIEAHQEVS